jgi:hypothetical protein
LKTTSAERQANVFSRSRTTVAHGGGVLDCLTVVVRDHPDRRNSQGRPKSSSQFHASVGRDQANPSEATAGYRCSSQSPFDTRPVEPLMFTDPYTRQTPLTRIEVDGLRWHPAEQVSADLCGGEKREDQRLIELTAVVITHVGKREAESADCASFGPNRSRD